MGVGGVFVVVAVAVAGVVTAGADGGVVVVGSRILPR